MPLARNEKNGIHIPNFVAILLAGDYFAFLIQRRMPIAQPLLGATNLPLGCFVRFVASQESRQWIIIYY